ncbi:magnesium chelatase subunit H [Ectothiorhodospira haloalkaliphila]|uniref:magnesium chelatase subunit H n=1 Tax=Ectothiorhodospira haloalkaliphila TaxID=421628 RepID=UPI001EE7E02B|nr:magnesium chelatase subunit H [Ectothiorhodospira haloalkaliphila]MCG5525359.1 magnesium chelatase subunit H [Ectothiorhodospira haloalkaliphila]
MASKPSSAADQTPVRVVIVTMDTHLASAADRARAELRHELPGLKFSLHAASEWAADEEALEQCKADVAKADIIITTMLFLEDQFQQILPDLQARRDDCDAMVCAMSAGDVTKLTRMGSFDMSKPSSGPMSLLKRLRGKKEGDSKASAGAQQMKMLRRIPQLLRFIPGTAQDVRAYFITLQYWLGGSEENMANMIRFLVDRYADGPRRSLRGKLTIASPAEYPEVGVYHPDMKKRLSDRLQDLPGRLSERGPKGRVGVLLLRSYVLAGNSGHYDPVIRGLEEAGLQVVPAFASGLDSRPAIEQFFMEDGRPTVDAVVSLTGFSLVGGPAYNDANAAQEILSKLDVPYIAAHPVEFQTLDQWGNSERGLLPVESTIMVAIPELDGCIAPMVYGGRPGPEGAICAGCERHCKFTDSENTQDMFTCPERTGMLVSRVRRLVELRRAERAERKVAIVLFNYPPNAGNTGTAAYLGVFESLLNTLRKMKEEGYQVEVPDSVDELRDSIIHGNKDQYGADANVHTMIPAEDHVRRERWLKQIEGQWGPAPGKVLTNGSSIFVLGKQFGNVLVMVQPSFGYEGDPMRLLFERGFAPTHAFSAFYRYLREDFKAHAVLHFGTHGALEFMPGKQVGMSGACWPDRLIGDIPNMYLYASNNPSEGAIAKRRSGATLISYLTPPVSHAGLYRGLLDLKSSIDRWRGLEPSQEHERGELAELIQSQAAELELAKPEPLWDVPGGEAEERVRKLGEEILELEYTLIPYGLHVVGTPLGEDERIDMLMAMAEASQDTRLERSVVETLVKTGSVDDALQEAGFQNDNERREQFEQLARSNELMSRDTELEGILKALDGRFIKPAPGGDVMRQPDVLPTGRNLHGFDPFRIPSAFALKDGAMQAERLLARHVEEGNGLPESVAMVLWGSDNLKTEGSQIGQVLGLLGAKPRFDNYGRLAGATLIPLEELGRPRVDVLITLSGIFRDLLPLQIKLLAEATFLAASAEEPPEQNFVRAHTLEYMKEHGCDLETAALRVYGNADGAYGSNVNNLVENGRWDDEDELANTYTQRKGFAYGRSGRPMKQDTLLKSMLKDVQLTYQNLDSVELGVTTIDNYFDTLGGISRAVRQARGGQDAPVYIGDQTKGEGTVRTLSEQVSLETRTRMLNPKWYEGALKHGYEGVRQIEVHITNTMGWSATTGQVQPWVYQKLSETFVLDPEMRERLAQLNPTASAKMANRLLEASDRNYWQPDDETLEALRRAGEELEDRLEGIEQESPAA